MKPWLALAQGLALALGLACGAALAEDRAILVGVNAYPQLPRRLALAGAVNDARAMQQWLAGQGWSRAAIELHTAPQGPGELPATLDALQSALRAALQQARPGDRVLLYLAGHGAQQPNPAEADGLDEVFLPTDAAPWSGQGRPQVLHGLVDDAIGDWMDALVDKGARVYAIFDTCHAVGMTRSGRGRSRAVAASDLGMPEPHGLQTNPAAPRVRTDGRWLALAAPSGSTTDEDWLPKDAPLAQRHVRGVFTSTLQSALRAGMTAVEANQSLRAAYAQAGRSGPVVLGDKSIRW